MMSATPRITRANQKRSPLSGAFLLLANLLLFSQYCRAAITPVLVDFEQFIDGTQLSNQVTGIAFVNATVLSSGVSLNEFEFPPHSGTNAAFDDGGPMYIGFLSPIDTVSAYFTYLSRLTLVAFDVSGIELASSSSAFTSNLAISGDAGSMQNEWLAVGAPAIAYITITGDPAGSSFVLDDLQYRLSGPAEAPEPSFTLLLLFTTSMIATRRTNSL